MLTASQLHLFVGRMRAEHTWDRITGFAWPTGRVTTLPLIAVEVLESGPREWRQPQDDSICRGAQFRVDVATSLHFGDGEESSAFVETLLRGE